MQNYNCARISQAAGNHISEPGRRRWCGSGPINAWKTRLQWDGTTRIPTKEGRKDGDVRSSRQLCALCAGKAAEEGVWDVWRIVGISRVPLPSTRQEKRHTTFVRSVRFVGAAHVKSSTYSALIDVRDSGKPLPSPPRFINPRRHRRPPAVSVWQADKDAVPMVRHFV